MKVLAPDGYVRQPWKNGLGVSVEIAAERDADGWDGLVWSLSRTGFDRPSHFSDLAGIDRIITVVRGSGLTLRAWDGGDDIAVPPFVPTSFDGGRVLEGVPHGPIEVVNLMGRRGQVRIGATLLDDNGPGLHVTAGRALLHACDGPVGFDHDFALPAEWFHAPEGAEWNYEQANRMPADHTLRLDQVDMRVEVLAGRLYVATIDRQNAIVAPA